MASSENIKMRPTKYTGVIHYYNNLWQVDAFNMPRDMIRHNSEYADLDIEGHGIYFLYGLDEKDRIRVYVGRSSETTKNVPFFTRLYQHKISKKEWYRNIWSAAIIIRFKELAFDEMRHLENYFYNEIKPEVRLNGTEPDTNDYTYSSIKDMVEYVKQYVTYMLGRDIFKESKKVAEPKEKPKLTYTEKELKSQGKRIIDKSAELITEMQTNLKAVNSTLDLLPKEIWNPNTKFLDLSCASGVYLKEVCNRLLQSDLYKGTPYESIPDRTLHIMTEQLYGIALSEESFEIACKNLKSRQNIVFIRYFNHIINNYNILEKSQKALNQLDKGSKEYKKLVKAITDCEEFFKTLKIKQKTIREFLIDKFGGTELSFDVIIGNPPYQCETKTIYNDFINTAIRLEPKSVAMVVKNNWLISDTLKETRNNMIEYGLTDIINYPIVGEVFNSVGTAVSIFRMGKGENREVHLQEIRNGKIISDFKADLTNAEIISFNKTEQLIINKFSEIGKNSDFGKLTYPSEPFRITTNGKVGRGDNAYNLEVYNEKSIENNVAVVYMDTNKEPYIKYTSRSKIPSRKELISKYKVVCGRILTKDSKVINNIRVLEPDTVCTSSWGLLYTSDQKDEAVNVSKYVKTKLFRFLLRSLSEDGVIALSAYRFSLIPIQDFSNSSDIDWTKNISEIDQQLYKKYNLSSEEIDYIENTIKSME